MLAGVVTLASLAAFPSVRFDYNRLALQAKGAESVTWEHEIMKSRRSGFAALATADSLAELRAKRDAFAALPAVSDVVSVLKLIPSDQEAKIAVLRDARAPDRGPARRPRVGRWTCPPSARRSSSSAGAWRLRSARPRGTRRSRG